MIVHNPNDLPTISIADLLPTQGDLKDLTEVNYKKLKNVIERRGFSYPVYVWEDKDKLLHLLDGHQRQRVLNREGWNDPIPYLKVPAKDLQEAMARLLEITSQYATITQEGIDEFIGKYELNDAEVYEATSFDALAFNKTEEEPEVEEDEAPEVSSEPPVSNLGDIYQLGRHRVMCGDSTDKSNVELLMNGVKADMVFTDPPYGVDYDGGVIHGSKINKDHKREKLQNDQVDIYKHFIPLLKDYVNGAVYIFYATRYSNEIFQALRDSKIEVMAVLTWIKTNTGYADMNSHYKNRYEPFVYCKVGDNTNFVGSTTENTTWEMDKDRINKEHPTQKPIEVCARAIKNHKGNTVLDLFLGSGSTLIACEQTDRICYGMELDPKYVDVIRKRYAKFIQPDNQLPDNWEELTPKITG